MTGAVGRRPGRRGAVGALNWGSRQREYHDRPARKSRSCRLRRFMRLENGHLLATIGQEPPMMFQTASYWKEGTWLQRSQIPRHPPSGNATRGRGWAGSGSTRARMYLKCLITHHGPGRHIQPIGLDCCLLNIQLLGAGTGGGGGRRRSGRSLSGKARSIAAVGTNPRQRRPRPGAPARFLANQEYCSSVARSPYQLGRIVCGALRAVLVPSIGRRVQPGRRRAPGVSRIIVREPVGFLRVALRGECRVDLESLRDVGHQLLGGTVTCATISWHTWSSVNIRRRSAIPIPP